MYTESDLSALQLKVVYVPEMNQIWRVGQILNFLTPCWPNERSMGKLSGQASAITMTSGNGPQDCKAVQQA